MICIRAMIVFFKRQFWTVSKIFRKDKSTYSEYNDIEFIILDGPDSPNNRAYGKPIINARGELCV